MATTFLQEGLWHELTAAIRNAKGKADVAVAYWGNGASALLPLVAGSRLVVDASEEAVKAGSTSPAELIRLHLNGVSIYSVPNLHAKLFLVGEQLFVGSANASLRSAESLVEAMLVTEDLNAVQEGRIFFDRLVLQPELGEASLGRLLQLYVPPKLEVMRKTANKITVPKVVADEEPEVIEPSVSALAVEPTRPTVWLTRVQAGVLPPGSDGAVELGRAMSLTKMNDIGKHKVDYQWDNNNEIQYIEGDTLIRILTYRQPIQVEYPVTVLHIRKWVGQNASATFVFIEALKIERAIAESTVLERLGLTDQPILESGPLAPEIAEKFFALWM